MNESRETSSRPLRINHYIFCFAVIWTVLVGSSLSWYLYEEQRHTIREAEVQVRENLDKNIVFYRWVTGHGGIYVPATKESPPNPYLSHIPERDIKTPSGRLLTLINPVYAMHFMHELDGKQPTIRGHLTSLNPLNPRNVPDPWEAAALRAFNQGKTEVSSVETKDGKSYLRLIRPLITDRGCLKCHAVQGDKEGDILGGIGVSVPLAPSMAIQRSRNYSAIIGHVVLWVLGLGGIVAGARRIGKRIRERDLSEEALRESEEQLATILRTATEGFWVTDRKGQFLEVNDAVCRNLGYSRDELLRMSVSDIEAVEKPEEILQSVQRIIERGSDRFEGLHRCKDGSLRNVEINVNYLPLPHDRFFAFLRDITERKRSEEVLKESEEKFRLIFDNASDGILVTDTESMKFEMGNRKICEMLGYSEEEIQRLRVLDIHPEKDLPYVLAELQKGATGKINMAMNIPMSRKDGSVFFADIAMSLITFHGTQFQMGIFRDLTRERILQKQLQTAQKMEEVGNLAGGIAHDFNNMLTVILGYGEMLKLRIGNDPKAVSDLGEILGSAERASVLTRQLLTFARRQVVEPVHLDMNEVMTGLVKLLRKVTREDIEIKTFPAECPVTIRADRGQVEQVLMNLCLNARDAMPAGGQLIIETGGTLLEEEYLKQYPYMKAGRYAVLSVSDTGIGMDEKTKDRIFEPFFTTKGPEKGTGLGLAMVYGIVKQHDGFIHVYSEPGKGTTFRVYFPEVDAPADAKVIASREAAHGGDETILLAEDNESLRHLAEQILISYGYKVLTACDGEEALDIFRRHGKEISMAVLDVVMPKMGGKEAYDEITKISPGLKALFLSGYSANAIHESFVLLPGISFLQKPFSPDALVRKVREVLDKA